MNDRFFSRRAFLRRAALSAAGLALVACQPKVVQKEKVIKETVIVEGTPKVVEKVVTPTVPPTPAIKGEITIGWWGDVDTYAKDAGEQGTSWQETYRLVTEWMAKHPDVKVNWLSIPIDGMEYTYLKTQLLADTLPDLVAGYPVIQFFEAQLDLFYDFANDLRQPNPYGIEATWDQEFPLGLRTFQHPSIPPDKVLFMGNTQLGSPGSVVFFYNVDMFAKAGISKRPETWAELMDASQKLNKAGFTAYFADGTSCCSLTWCFVWIQDQLFDPVIRQISGALHPRVCADQPRCFYITQEERAWAITKGIWRANDPRFLEMYRLMKEWSPYWNQDWAAPEKVDYFLAKRVAITQQHISSLNQIIKAKERDFEFGTFYFPQITKESSQYATGAPVRRHGGWAGGSASTSFFVPKTTADKGTLPVVKDLLQYITSKSASERWCKPQYPPCVPPGKKIQDVIKDAKELDRLYGFYNPPTSPDQVARMLEWPGSADQTSDRLFVQYIQDSITLEQLGKELQADFERQAQKLITDNPDWKTVQWPEK